MNPKAKFGLLVLFSLSTISSGALASGGSFETFSEGLYVAKDNRRSCSLEIHKDIHRSKLFMVASSQGMGKNSYCTVTGKVFTFTCQEASCVFDESKKVHIEIVSDADFAWFEDAFSMFWSHAVAADPRCIVN